MFVVCLIAMHLWRINNNTNNTTYNIKLQSVTKYFYIKNSENNTSYILYIRKRWILNKKKKKKIVFKEIIVQSEGLTQSFLDNKAPRKYYWRLKMHRVEWTKGKSRNRILKTFQFQRKISP